MKGTVLSGPRDVRFEERDAPTIIEPTDAIIKISATCVCGSDLWPYRGISTFPEPTPMGHEYCGIVEEVGSAVTSVKPGQFVIGYFATSDNTCPHCRAGYQSSCIHREFMTRAQAPVLRVPLADGTLVATPDVPPDDMIPSLLTTSDVLGTGWFAADAANVKPGSTVVVVSDGAVGLLAVLSASRWMPADCDGRYDSRRSFPIPIEAVAQGTTTSLRGARSWAADSICRDNSAGPWATSAFRTSRARGEGLYPRSWSGHDASAS